MVGLRLCSIRSPVSCRKIGFAKFAPQQIQGMHSCGPDLEPDFLKRDDDELNWDSFFTSADTYITNWRDFTVCWTITLRFNSYLMYALLTGTPAEHFEAFCEAQTYLCSISDSGRVSCRTTANRVLGPGPARSRLYVSLLPLELCWCVFIWLTGVTKNKKMKRTE